MSARVLVTGGSGFIGTWVLHELLQRNLTAVVIDLHPAHARWQELLGDRAREVVWAKASLTDRDSLSAVIQEHQVSYIIHLAALLTPDCQQRPWDGCRVNVLGSTTVFDRCPRMCVSSCHFVRQFLCSVRRPGHRASETTSRTDLLWGVQAGC